MLLYIKYVSRFKYILRLDKLSSDTVAPCPYKDKNLLTLKISTDPIYIWFTDSQTVRKQDSFPPNLRFI